MTGENIVKPFIEQYDMIRKYISVKNRIVIGTMGPESTSSVQAAKYLCEALVPSAYERVTDFFWDVSLENCLNFIFPTPQYGLVCKNEYQVQPDKNVTVATCHAVEHIIVFHKYNAKIVWCVFRNKEKCNEVTEY